jgi:hypothetical protein
MLTDRSIVDHTFQEQSIPSTVLIVAVWASFLSFGCSEDGAIACRLHRNGQMNNILLFHQPPDACRHCSFLNVSPNSPGCAMEAARDSSAPVVSIREFEASAVHLFGVQGREQLHEWKEFH